MRNSDSCIFYVARADKVRCKLWMAQYESDLCEAWILSHI